MISILINSLLIGYSGAVMPGALLTYTIEQSLKKGTKVGLLVSIGHALLELLLVILLFAGAGTILQNNTFQIVISICGGLFMIYLGASMTIEAIKNKLSIDIEGNVQSDQNYKLVTSGATISFANPYFLIWWTVVGMGLVMSAYSIYGLFGIIAFYIGHILADISWYLLIAFMVAKSKKFISDKIYKVVVAALGVFLVYFGGTFLMNGINLL